MRLFIVKALQKHSIELAKYRESVHGWYAEDAADDKNHFLYCRSYLSCALDHRQRSSVGVFYLQRPSVLAKFLYGNLYHSPGEQHHHQRGPLTNQPPGGASHLNLIIIIASLRVRESDGVKEISQRILNDGLENTVSIHRSALSLTSRCHWDKAKDPTEQEPRSDTDSEEVYKESNNHIGNMYVVDQIGLHISLWPASGIWWDAFATVW